MDVTKERGRWEIAINGDTVNLPADVREYVVIRKTVVILLEGWATDPDVEMFESMGIDMSDVTREPDIELEDPYRNVVGLDPTGDLKWTIPEAPHDPPEGDEPYYQSLWTSDGELWVRNKNHRNYRVDPKTGELLEETPANELRLGGETITFDHGWVGQVLYNDDIVAVRLALYGHPDADGRNVYVFDEDGTKRWWIGDHLDEEAGPDMPQFTNIRFEDDLLFGYAIDGYDYCFDPRRGALLGQKFVK